MGGPIARILCTIVVFGLSSVAFGQTAATGALMGTAKDPSGARIANATVRLTSTATSVIRSATTDNSGVYRFTLLPPGTYQAEFQASGFKTVAPVTVNVNITEMSVLDVTMIVGEHYERVSVSAEPELVQSQSSTLGTLIEGRSITEVPLTTRNYTQLLGLSPGVLADIYNAGQVGKGTQDVYVNGSINTSNNFQMDGSDINNFGNGRANEFRGYAGIAIPNPDAIQEFKIQTSLYDAGYGRAAGANVNVVTKSGSNEWHGALFEFFRNDVLNANDFFLKRNGQARPVMKQNQFGGILGGPILKNKNAFFFISYQGTRQINGLGANSLSSNFLPPLTDDRSATALGRQFCGRTGIFGGVGVSCDGSNINPVALKILNFKLKDGTFYIPTPQVIQPNGLGFSVFSIPSRFREDQFLVNTDYVISKAHTLSERFFYSRDPQTVAFTDCQVSPCTPGSGADSASTNSNASLKLISTLNRRMVNEARATFTRNARSASSQTPIKDADIGLTPSDPNFPLLPTIAITGLFSLGGFYVDDFLSVINQFQYGDQISWASGRHNIRSGFQFDRVQDNLTAPGVTRGQLRFQSFADFLLGMSAAQNGSAFSNIFKSVGIAGPTDRHFRVNDYAAFFQDDFKFNPRLTLNLGLRWEINGGASEWKGRLTNVWPSVAATVNPPPVSGTFVGFNVPSNATEPVPDGVAVRPNETGARNGAPLHNFGPRLGFAWRPLDKNDRLVLRGGYGVFYTRVHSEYVYLVEVNQPFLSTVQMLGQANAAATFQVPFNPAPTPGVWVPRTPTSQLTANILAEDYDSPMTQQYSLNLQYQFLPNWLVEVGYVGTRSTRLASQRQINEPLLASPTQPVHGITTNTVANAAQRVPILGFGPTGLMRMETYGFSMYNSLQSVLRRRFRHGLELQAAYTWGKALTDVPTEGGASTLRLGNSNSGDPNDRRQRWGLADFDRAHRFVLGYLWELPRVVTAKSFDGKFLNGWTLSGVTTFQTGSALTILDPRGGSIFGFASNSRATLCPGFTNADIPTRGGVESRLDNFFNAAAFCPPPVIGNGTGWGTLPRGVVRGPGQQNFDISLSKRIKVGGLRENAQLDFRTEFFNAFNHPQFADPGVSVGSASFGEISKTAVAPRLIQFGLKYVF